MAANQAQPAAANPINATPVTAEDILRKQSLHFDPFKPDEESFECYISRLENYFELKGLTSTTPDADKAKVRLLIHCIGSKYFQLLTDLCSPDTPTTKSYADLVKLLKDNIVPPLNELSEQHKFFSAVQEQGTTLAQYVAHLKKLAKSTNFTSHCKDDACSKNFLDTMIRAQFIRGLQDSHIREAILIQGAQPLDKVLQTAYSIETSRTQNRDYNNMQSTDAVHQVNRSRGRKSTRGRSRSRSRPQGSRSQYRSKNRKQEFLKKLGLEGLCLHCGKDNHRSKECKSVDKLSCDGCHKKGHIAKVCITTLTAKSQRREDSNTGDAQTKFIAEANAIDDDIESYSFSTKVIDVFVNRTQSDDKIYATVGLNGVSQKMECDSGSRFALLNVNDYHKLNIKAPIQESSYTFRSYTGHLFKPVGFVKLQVTFEGLTRELFLYLVDMDQQPILGREWMRAFNIDLRKLDNVKKISESISEAELSTLRQEVFTKYADVFQKKIGLVPNYTCTLKLKDEAKPVFMKPRTIPYALRPKVEKELESLEQQGIIEKVDHSEWGTPIVVVPHGDGVRICADFKPTVNPQLAKATYPVARIDDIFIEMKGGVYFCKVDIHKAYLHLAVDPESAKIQAISTHKGTYLVKRLFFGIKTAPNEFHKFIDQVI